MRLWTLHPRMLDNKGLVALWLEGLGAQKALDYYTKGEPFGYQHHPQLDRFKASAEPLASIVYYMQTVYNESLARGYSFNKSLILPYGASADFENIPVTTGQINYEMQWLKYKLLQRSPGDLSRLENVTLHTLFQEIDGEIEPWERIQEF
jgi:hypothetical protein